MSNSSVDDMPNQKSSSFTLLALMISIFSVGTAEYVISGLLPEISHGLEISVPTTGWLVTAYALTVMIGGPLVTAATVKFKRRPLLLVLMTVFALGNVLAAVAPGFGLLAVGRIASALAHSTFFAVSLMVTAMVVPPEKQGAAIARVALGLNLATVLGVPLGTLLGHAAGWRSTFWALAILSVIGIAMLALTLPRTGIDPGSDIRAEGRALLKPAVLAAFLMTGIGQVGGFMVIPYIAPMLTDISGFDGGIVGPLLLAMGLGAIAGNWMGGKFADRSLLPSLTGLIGLNFLVLAVFAFALENKIAAIAVLVLLGVAQFSVIPGLQARILQAAGGAATLAVSANISAFQLSAAAGAFLGGAVIDADWGLGSVSRVGACLAVVGVIFTAIVTLRARRATTTVPTSPAPATSDSTV